MKKRMLAILAAGAVCMSMPLTAFAEETTQNLTATLTADPSYTVTIPGSVSMGNEGTMVDVTAADVTNLPEGQKISVTIAGTSAYRDQMVLEAPSTGSGRTSIRYQIISEDGELIESNASTDASGVGKEVVSFTEDGTKQYEIKPVLNGRYEYNVDYTGSITFGIGLAESA
ncbi:MAG: hypothetical protein ACOX8H_00690 [Ruminococcus sp.]|jgi:hypothetical protein